MKRVAFLDNKPFDQFTREQIAGDLLAKATLEQRVASAYNRLNRTSAEGGVQPKEYLAKYGADRVRTLSAVWLGSTMGCAECHDHKFNPFLTKDFCAMKAFFADVKETGLVPDRGPTPWGTSSSSSRYLSSVETANRRRIKYITRKATAVAFQNLSKPFKRANPTLLTNLFFPPQRHSKLIESSMLPCPV